MKHLTPDEVRRMLRREVQRLGSAGKLAKISGCAHPNLSEAIAGRRQIPRPAAKYLNLERVTAYVRAK